MLFPLCPLTPVPFQLVCNPSTWFSVNKYHSDMSRWRARIVLMWPKGLTPWSSWDLRTLQLNPMLMSQSGDLNSGCMPSVLLLTWRSAFRIWNYALFSSVIDLPNEIPKFMFTLFSLQGAQIGLTLRDVEIALMLETARTYPRRWPWMWNQSNLKQASF